MLVGTDGLKSISSLLASRELTLTGCLFDPESEGITPNNFQQDIFIVTLGNIINPLDPEDL